MIQRLPLIRKGDKLPGDFQHCEVAEGHIIVWVCLLRIKQDRPHPEARPFPAIVDTGYPGGFAITEELLYQYTHVLPKLDKSRVRGEDGRGSYRILERKLWLYPNKPGTFQLNASGPRGMIIEIDRGIKLYQKRDRQAGEHQRDPRPNLPLVGMHSLLRNSLVLHIDGNSREVSLTKWAKPKSSLWDRFVKLVQGR